MAKAEVVSKRTPTSKTFQLSDGTFETEFYRSPIFYASDETATLQPIDASLTETVTSTGREFQSNANSFKSRLPANLNTQWASIENTAAVVAYRPISRPFVPENALAMQAKGVRNGFGNSRVDYPGAFDVGTLEYESHPSGLKETIVLDHWSGRNVFSFELTVTGAWPYVNQHGGIDFISAESTVPVFQMTPPYMEDSADLGQGERNLSRAVRYELEPTERGWRLDVVADRAWLQDSDRVYPVRIDPTVRYGWMEPYYSGECVYVSEAEPAANCSTVYQDGTYPLKVGKPGSTRYRSLVQGTDLPSWFNWYRGADDDTDIQISYARLELNCYYASPNPMTVRYSEITTPWDHETVTWNTRPSTVQIDTFNAHQGEAWNIYITDLAQKWLSDPSTNHGVMLWSDTAGQFAKFNGLDMDLAKIPYFRFAWTTVPKVEITSPAPDTAVGGEPTIIWDYDDDTHGRTDGTSLISKPQSSIQIQVAETPASSPLFTITRNDWSDYDKTIMASDYNGWVAGKRYFVRMRAAGATSVNAGHDPEIWSNWTEWTSFVYRPVADASDDGGIEAHRASEPIGAGASVELSSGALVISREDLSGPARGGSLAFGMTYRSDQTGTAEAPAVGWRLPLPALCTDDERAPDPEFKASSPYAGGWTVSSGTATVAYAGGGRSDTCLSFTAALATSAYVGTTSNATAHLLKVYPGERLDASAYLKGQNLTVDGDTAPGSDLGGVVKVRFYDAEGAYLTDVASGNYTEQNATSWRKVDLKAIAPKSAYYARMTIDFVNATGTLLVDDAHFGNRRLFFTDADGTGHHYEQTADGRYTVDPLNNQVAPELAELARGAKVSASSPAVNKVPESGFETVPTPDWYRSDTAVITRSSTLKRTGSYSMRFYSSAYTSAWLSSAVPTSAMMAVVPGEKAYATAWVNSTNLYGEPGQTERGVLLKIHYYTAAGSLISGASISSGNFTAYDMNGWKQLAASGAAPASAAFAKCNVEYRNARNVVYVDDVEFSTGCPGVGRSVDGDDAVTTTGYDSVALEGDGSTWLQYDLGKSQVFSDLALTLWDQPLDPASDVATYTYSIRVSDDASFTTSTEIVASTSQRGFVEHRLARPAKGRYLRIIPTSVSGGDFFRITEFSLPQLRMGRMPVMTDASGRVNGFADESSNLISRDYDASGRLSTLSDETGRRITLDYSSGRLGSLKWEGVDSNGASETIDDRVIYTSADETFTVSADEGGGPAAVCSYHYTGGRIDRIVDADGVAIGIDYVGNRVSAVHYADGTTKSFAAGTNQADIAIGSEQETITSRVLWDAATQRIIKTISGVATSVETSTTYKYDGYGNTRYVIDGEGHQTTTIADGHGNVVRADEAGVRESTARYENDLVVETKDAKGNTATFEYDDARRLLSASSALSEEGADEEGAERATYATYDEYGNKLTGNLAGSTAANLVLNGGFERDPMTDGNGWDAVRSGASLAAQTVDANTGAAYVRLHSASTESYMFSDYIDVDAAKTYALSAWTRGDGHIEIREYNNSGTQLDTRAPIRFSGATSEPFERAVSTYWPTPGTGKVRVRLWADAGDTAHIDNVRLEMATRAGSDNFCDNGSFEITSGAYAKAWTKRYTTTANQEVLSDAVGVSGVRTIRIDVETQGDGGDGYFVSSAVPVVAGARYSASGYMKTGKLTNDAMMRVVWRNAANQVVSTSVFATATGTTAWKRYVGNVTTPAGATKAELSCFAYGGQGAVRFDAVALEPVRNSEVYHYDDATKTYLVRTDTAQGRSVGSVVDARGRSVRSTYATSTGGAKTVVSSSEYDGRGRLATVTAFPASDLGITAHYDYTAAGRLTRVTDPLQRVYELSYTPSGKLERVTDPLGYVSTTLYDGLGRVHQQLRPSMSTEPTSALTESRYDELSRLSSRTFFDSAGAAVESATITYDRDGNVTRSALTSATWSVDSDYDALDRLTDLDGTGPAGDYGFSTTYDLANLPESVDYRAFGATKTVDNTYLKTNEWKSTKLVGDSSTWFFSFGLGGELRRWGSSIGFALRDYDAAGRFKSLRLGRGPDGVDRYAYQTVTYDDWERIGSISTDYFDQLDALDSFRYDAAGRLTVWTRSGSDAASATYAYDAAGNMIGRTEDGVTKQLSYNAANQLTTETAGEVETTHGYDELGRLVSSETSTATTSYTWDARGPLVGIASSEMTVSFEYGVEGMRQKKSVETSAGTSSTKSVWDGQRLVAESYSDGSRADFLYGPEGMPLELVYTASEGAKTIYAYQLDAGGSVIGLTTATGTEVAKYAYDPWGSPIALSTSASHPAAARNPLRYRGYYWDGESGLYYLPARYYDPNTARFLSVDPAAPAVSDPSSLNRYAYCGGDPVDAVDPTGAVMTEFYRHDERFSSEEELAKVRNVYSGLGGRRHWSPAAKERAIAQAKRADAVRRYMERALADLAGPGAIPNRDLDILMVSTALAYQMPGLFSLLRNVAIVDAQDGDADLPGIAGRITGYSDYAIGRMAGNRAPNDGGVARWAVDHTVAHPNYVVWQANDRLLYRSDFAGVVLDMDGTVVTLWSYTSAAHAGTSPPW